jgi:pimeloyl-ACP methyl ester esterase
MMPFLETAQGVRIHYETAGDGPPLVFLHGWAMSGRVWRLQEGLAERYRLVVPDLRGHGLSSAPASGYSYENFADDLVALFGALRLENAVLIAWSMGVQVALQAYPLLKERLAALVFVSGTPRFTAGAEYPHGVPSVETKGMSLRLKRDHARTVSDFSRRIFAEGELHPIQCEQIISEAIRGESPAYHALQQTLASLASADLRTVLPSVALPVLLIHGSADTICPSSASRYMAGQLPDARLVEMEGVGHAPFLSRSAEFTVLLTKFLDEIHADDRQA